MLHVAPEACLGDRFKESFDYVSVDLKPGLASMAMDITAIQFPDESFDAIVCNHVLEHIPHDRKATAELYRVLKPGGWASIQVPMEGELTQEDLSITDPGQRQQLYGQSDHVRQYGSDFQLMLQDVGFHFWKFPKEELLSPQQMHQLSVECEREVWICLKEKV
jgi:predicted SAM-dependent methyltransferase